jgi:hypothetical protein
MSTNTLPSQLLGTMASAAGSGLDTASHLVADATESLGDIAGSAIDVGGSAAGVIADSTVRGARSAWRRAPGAYGFVRTHPVLVVGGAVVLAACVVAAQQRRHSSNGAAGEADERATRGVRSVDAA